MSALYLCSSCCMILSVWAVFQLIIMGIFYYIEATVLVEDVFPREYENHKDFIRQVHQNYSSVAINCWVVAAIYLMFLGLSCLGLRRARKTEKIEAARRDDDEYICQPEMDKKV